MQPNKLRKMSPHKVQLTSTIVTPPEVPEPLHEVFPAHPPQQEAPGPSQPATVESWMFLCHGPCASRRCMQQASLEERDDIRVLLSPDAQEFSTQIITVPGKRSSAVQTSPHFTMNPNPDGSVS